MKLQFPDVATALLMATCVILLQTLIASAPVDENTGETSDQRHIQEQNEEEQLESLKSLSGNVAVIKTKIQSYNEANGKKQLHKTEEEKVEDVASGKTVAKIAKDVIKTVDSPDSKPKTLIKTEVDIPSKGIHEVNINKKAKVASSRNTDGIEVIEDYYTPYDTIQYTPTDMAEYIRRTGDDEGVALAIEELMKEGLMSRNEAVNYLGDIKNELEEMDSRPQTTFSQHNNQFPYSHQLNRDTSMSTRDYDRRPSLTVPMTSQIPSSLRKGQHLMNDKGESKLMPSSLTGIKHGYTSLAQTRYNTIRNADRDELGDEDPSLTRSRHGNNDEDADYNDLLERLRIADFLYSEYSLEEVIYQLAKEMFTQSILKGNKAAEESLLRFSNFLQEETAEGRISKELETKILDVVMAALMDSVGNQMIETNRKDSKEHQGSRIMTSGKSLEANRIGMDKMQKGNSKGQTMKHDKKNDVASDSQEQSTADEHEDKVHKRETKTSQQQ